MKRLVWLETLPAGKYGQYAKAKLKVSERFEDGSSMGYGIKIYNDQFPRTGDFLVQLQFGCITFGAPPIPNEHEISVFNGRVTIRGPNDTTAEVADAGPASVCTSELGFFDDMKKKSITTDTETQTAINHYKVGDRTAGSS